MSYRDELPASLPSQKTECRVLQIFSRLGIGGAETWLIAFLKYFDGLKDDLPVRLRFDICLTSGQKGHFDEEASALGANLFYLNYTRKTLPVFIRRFRSILAEGRYHAIHDHQDYTAGWHFLFGLGHLPPVRIAHVHNPSANIAFFSRSQIRRGTLLAGKNLLAHFATHIMGTSMQVITEYGFDEPAFRRVKLGTAHCGFDVTRYKGDHRVAHDGLCKEFGWPNEVKILLFVGRLDSNLNQKNPGFALDVARDCIARDPGVRLLMAGDGEFVRKELEDRVRGWGLQEKIRLIGPRGDVPRLMLGSDLFLLTSLSEGLGMVAVEAQAAGLKVLASDTTPRECVAHPDMIRFKSLGEGVGAWTGEALRFLKQPCIDASACNLAVMDSPFSIENSAQRLLRLYTGIE